MKINKFLGLGTLALLISFSANAQEQESSTVKYAQDYFVQYKPVTLQDITDHIL